MPGAAGVVVVDSSAGGRVVGDTTVVGVPTTVVVVVVVVVVTVGTRAGFGVTATLLRFPLSPPTTAMIQQRDEVGGVKAKVVSVRPFGAIETLLRSTVMTVSIGEFTVSASSSASGASSFSFELRLLTHSMRYDSGLRSSNQEAVSTGTVPLTFDRRLKVFGCTTSRFFAGRFPGLIVVVVAMGTVVGATVVGATVTSGAVVVVGTFASVVVVGNSVVVVASTGTSCSTSVVTASEPVLFAVSFVTISLLEIPGKA